MESVRSPEDTKRKTTYPSHSTFTLLLSGKQYRSIRCWTAGQRCSFFPQALRLLKSTTSITDCCKWIYLVRNLMLHMVWNAQCSGYCTASISPLHCMERSTTRFHCSFLHWIMTIKINLEPFFLNTFSKQWVCHFCTAFTIYVLFTEGNGTGPIPLWNQRKLRQLQRQKARFKNR